MVLQKSFCRLCVGVCGITVDIDNPADSNASKFNNHEFNNHEFNNVNIVPGAVTIRGDRDHPFSAGYVCTKGRALPDLHLRSDRLNQPLVQTVPGKYSAVDWGEVMTDIGHRLQDVVETHGPDSIGVFLGNGTYSDAAGYWAANRLKRRLGTKHVYSNMTIDSGAKYRVAELMAGTQSLVPHADPAARLLLMFGTNPVVSHGQTPNFENPIERLRQHSQDGEIWVVDPRQTESSRLAGHHLAIRPGTDFALLAYLVRHFLESCDETELRAKTCHLDELREAVSPYDLVGTAGRTGLDPDDLVQLVGAIEHAGRIAILSGTGITMSPGANAAEWLITALLLVTDSFDQPGGMWVNPGYIARLNEREVLPSVPPVEPGSPTRSDIPRLMGEWPAGVIPAEIEAGNLKALVVLGANLVTCLPDTTRTAAALANLDVLISLDILPTETTAISTHVLPVHAQLERPDITMLNDLFNPIVATQYSAAVLPRHEGRRSAWWVLAQIGMELGVDVLPARLDIDTASDDQILEAAVGPDLVAQLRDGEVPWASKPMPEWGWVQDRLPEKRWDIAPEALVQQLAELADPQSLVLIPRRQPRRMNARAMREGDKPDILLSTFDAQRHGIHDGDLVKVTSEAGSIRLVARVGGEVRPGAVSIAHGWIEANVNVLISSDDLDPLTGMPGLSGTPVTLSVVSSS